MTPRDAAIATYADAERRLRDLARQEAEKGAAVMSAIARHRALICHRAMLADLLDPEPTRVRRSA